MQFSITFCNIQYLLAIVATVSAQTSTSGSTLFANISEPCGRALNALNSSTAAACPLLPSNVISTLVQSISSNGSTNTAIADSLLTTYIQSVCVNQACAHQFSSFVSLLTDGECSQDSINVVTNNITSRVDLSLIAFQTAVNNAILCQKTSDSKAFCALKQVYSSSASGSINIASSLASYINVASSMHANYSESIISISSAKSQICTDCLSRQLKAALGVKNLSESLAKSVSNLDSQLTPFCGSSLTTVLSSNSALQHAAGSSSVFYFCAAIAILL